MARRPTKRRDKTPSLRQRKVNSFLQKKISRIIQELPASDLMGLVTVTDVQVTPDLREAKVWASVLNQQPEEALAILNRHLYDIQGELYRGSTMRVTPKIHFAIDRSGEVTEELNDIFKRLHDE